MLNEDGQGRKFSMGVIKGVAGICVFVLVATGPASADLEKPAGSVILTIDGAVTETNRGPSNTFDNAFLSSHEYSFEKAVTFDVAMLENSGWSQRR